MKQEMWTICKSFASHFRQITLLAPHHSVFLQAASRNVWSMCVNVIVVCTWWRCQWWLTQKTLLLWQPFPWWRARPMWCLLTAWIPRKSLIFTVTESKKSVWDMPFSWRLLLLYDSCFALWSLLLKHLVVDSCGETARQGNHRWQTLPLVQLTMSTCWSLPSSKIWWIWWESRLLCLSWLLPIRNTYDAP